MTTTGAPHRWYEVPLVPALLVLHLLVECASTGLNSLLADDSLGEALGLGTFVVAIEVLFLLLVWQRRRWAWYLVAVTSVLWVTLLVASFPVPEVWYDQAPPTMSAVASLTLALASSAIWFFPALRAHVFGTDPMESVVASGPV